jgi:C1A family cysteine protease
MSLTNNKFKNIWNEDKGFGYLKAFNSHKDFSIDNEQVKPLLEKSTILSNNKKLFTKKDLRKQMTPIRDQGSLGSCTAFSVASLVEYIQKRAYKKYVPISTLFTYKLTRNLMRLTGDTGAYMRSVMGSIAIFGSPPEEYYPYDISKFDKEPTPFHYGFASNYQGIKYLRLDQPDTEPKQLVHLLKLFLSRNYPSIFGFTCFDSLQQTNSTDSDGSVPYPSTNEHIIGGHAVCLAGYDDTKEITNFTSGEKTTGAFLFKNSWGLNWGDMGYGWIPYKYFEDRLADDCWTLIKQEWMDHIQFQE